MRPDQMPILVTDVNDAQQHVTAVGIFGICYWIWAMAMYVNAFVPCCAMSVRRPMLVVTMAAVIVFGRQSRNLRVKRIFL